MAAKSNETTRGPHKAQGWTLCVEVTAINDLAQQKVHQTKVGVGKEKTILKNVCLLLIWALLWLLVTVTLNTPTSRLNCLPVSMAV